MPTKKRATAKRSTATRPSRTQTARKAPTRASAAKPPRLGKREHAKQVKERLHGAIRSHQSVSESELEATTVAVLAVVAELAAETAAVFGEVLARIETLERRMVR